eukprot:747607-Hanusia_phi.AAC.2
MLSGLVRFPLPVEDPTQRLSEGEEKEALLLNQFRRIIGHRILQGVVPLPAFAASRRMLLTAFDERLTSYMASYGSILRDWDFAAYTVRLQEVASERQCLMRKEAIVHSEFASRRVFVALSMEMRSALGAFFSDSPPPRSHILGRMRSSVKGRACLDNATSPAWGHIAGSECTEEKEVLTKLQPAGGQSSTGGQAVARSNVRLLDPGGKLQNSPFLHASSNLTHTRCPVGTQDIQGIVVEISGNRLHEGVLEVRRLRQELSISSGKRGTSTSSTLPSYSSTILCVPLQSPSSFPSSFNLLKVAPLGLGALQLVVWAVDKDGKSIMGTQRTVNFVG